MGIIVYMEDMLQYLAGQIDGDGCISIRLPSPSQKGCGRVVIEVDKAKRNVASLAVFKKTFGGYIKNERVFKTGNCQNSQKWVLEGRSALLACKRLLDHIVIKRPQVKMALELPIDDIRKSTFTPIKGINTLSGTVREFESTRQAAKMLGIKSPSNILDCIKGKQHKSKGWTFELLPPLDVQMVKESVQTLKQRLSDAKKIPHVVTQEFISIPYMAGFFDAEGCVCLRKDCKGVLVCVGQKYPAILQAAQRTFGGTVSTSTKREISNWCLGKGAKDFLGQIRPFLVEKGEQVDLVLNVTSENLARTRVALRSLKANSKKAAAIAELDDCGEAQGGASNRPVEASGGVCGQ